MRVRRLLGLGVALALALVAARLVAPRLRARIVHAAPTTLVRVPARELERLFRQGPARTRAHQAAPTDLAREGPRPVAELLPALDESERTAFFAQLGQGEIVPDPLRYFARVPNVDRWQPFEEHPRRGFRVRTDALGLRRDGEAAAERPALRVLVSGDSHVDGVVGNRQNLCAILERRLVEEGVVPSAEVLNAGLGGSTFMNYLGTLERYAELRPHVFVSTIYGGNDFYAQCVFERYRRGLALHRRFDASIAAVLAGSEEVKGLLAQDLLQALHFAANPEDEDLAVASALEYELAIDARCRELGARSLVVYLPPASAVQRERFLELYADALTRAERGPELLAVSDRIADRLLAGLRAAGVPCVDLRPFLRAASQPAYWSSDLHLSVHGHSLAAAAVYPELVALAPAR